MSRYLLPMTAGLLIAAFGALAVAHHAGTIEYGCMAMTQNLPTRSGQPPNQQWPQPR
jgi:hypothetical protein